MTIEQLVWDNLGDRIYETGLDRGVLYLPDGSGVAWNGLVSIVESFDKTSTPIYYDGMKINDLVALGDFSAIMSAITYPDEFIELEGFGSSEQGVIYADQTPKAFGLSYRTKIGNDIDGDDAGYKLHIVYNVTAIPVDKTYATTTGEVSVNVFQWNISAIPEEVPGFRPTSHIIIDSRKIRPLLLETLEYMLYGKNNVNGPFLIPMADFVTFINTWYSVQIIDNGDGTWTAIDQDDSFIDMVSADEFQIINVDATYVDSDTFIISDSV